MGLAYGSKPVMKQGTKEPKNTSKESILDDDELDTVDADHDNLQYVAEQLEEIVRNYTNYGKDTQIRFHLKKGTMNSSFKSEQSGKSLNMIFSIIDFN